jgi:hypothetical protein
MEHVTEEFNGVGKEAGPTIAVIGAVVSTGLAVAEDIHNGAGVVNTAVDASATLSSDLAVSACPPLAFVNTCTGGAVSASVHNALAAPATALNALAGHTSTGDMDAIKKMYTRNWFTSAVWKLGEKLANVLVPDEKPSCN